MGKDSEFLRSRDKKKIWQKYCGFFDLSVKEFMEIQEHLLLDQLRQISDTPLSQKILKGAHPQTVEELRQQVPLTTYADYAPYIGNCQEEYLVGKPACWARTSGRGGTPKWVPYTEEALNWLGMLGIATLMLACASKKGEVRINNTLRLMMNLPPRPYYSGYGVRAACEYIDLRMIPPLDKYENESFEKRNRDGFRMAMGTGLDVLASMTSVLIRMGEQFAESSGKLKVSRTMLHPRIILRLLLAFLASKRENRPMLPRDLWHLKGLVCYGIDSGVYRNQIKYYWGREPLELYGSTEATLIAIQAWNKKAMSFYPFSAFYEFVPEEEWLKSRADKAYQPRTALLNEVEPGKIYELVITSFFGLPFFRYRIGDLIKIVALEDREAGITNPQLVFYSRADDLIDIGGFTRLDEKTLHQAIANVGISHNGWTARKGNERDKPILQIYIELKDGADTDRLEPRLHEQLKCLNEDYSNLEGMLGIKPLRITFLAKGSFQRYYEYKRQAGADLAHLKPPQMNAFDRDIEELLNITRQSGGTA